MNGLNFREREFVALGAAMGSNCVPCVEHHLAEARRAGLTDSQISAAIQLADQIRKVPAAKVLNAAVQMLGGELASVQGSDSLCGKSPSTAATDGPCCT